MAVKTKMPISKSQSEQCVVRNKRGHFMNLTFRNSPTDCEEAFLVHYPQIERGAIRDWEHAESKGYFVDHVKVVSR